MGKGFIKGEINYRNFVGSCQKCFEFVYFTSGYLGMWISGTVYHVHIYIWCSS